MTRLLHRAAAGKGLIMSMQRGGRGGARAVWLAALDPLILMEGVAGGGKEASSALARTLIDRADVLLTNGKRSAAVECAQRAVEASGLLDEAESGRPGPEAARALTVLARALAATSRQVEAVTLAAHAVRLHEKSATTSAEDARPKCAEALREHARRLAGTGRLREALEVSARSVSFYEEAAESTTDALWAGGLAASLTTHAELLTEAGSVADALETSLRSVRLYEAARIDEHEYADALLVRATALCGVGRWAEALKHTQHAVDLCTETTDAYLHADDLEVALSAYAIAWTRARADVADLALALTSHAKVLAESGQRSAALDASRDAVEYWRRLDAAEPGSYQAELAAGRLVFASIRTDSKVELEPALSEAKAALAAYRELTAREGESFAGRTRAAAAVVSNALDALGRAEPAEAEPETVTGSPRHPDRATPDGLFFSFWNTARVTASRSGNRAAEGSALIRLASAHWQAERIEEAIHHGELAITCSRESDSRHTEAMALFLVGVCQMRAGRVEAAIEADRQAADAFRELGDESGEGGALNNLSHALRESRRFEEAVEVGGRAIELLHGQREPLNEGIALDDLGIALTALERFAEAAEAMRKAVVVFRSIDNRECEGSTLNDLGNTLMRLDRFDEAADAFQRAATLLGGTAEHYRAGAAWQGLSRARLKSGRPDEARSAAQRAAAIFRAIGELDAERAALRVVRDAARVTDTGGGSRTVRRSATAADLERARIIARLFAQAGGGALADPKVQRAAQAGLRVGERILDSLQDARRLTSATHRELRDYVAGFRDSFDLAAVGATVPAGDDADTDSQGRPSPFQGSQGASTRRMIRHYAILAAATKPDQLESRIRSIFSGIEEIPDHAFSSLLEQLISTGARRSPVVGDAEWAHAAARALIAAGTGDDRTSRRAAWRRILSSLGDSDRTVHRRRRELVYGLLLATLGNALFERGRAVARDFAGDAGGDLSDSKVRNAASAALATIELGLTGLHETGSLDDDSYFAVFELTTQYMEDLKLF